MPLGNKAFAQAEDMFQRGDVIQGMEEVNTGGEYRY